VSANSEILGLHLLAGLGSQFRGSPLKWELAVGAGRRHFSEAALKTPSSGPNDQGHCGNLVALPMTDVHGYYRLKF
jgi:hypothetical protein